MPAKERQQSIVGALQAKGRVSVGELSELTGVSEMTVRRDLESLEQDGVLQRVHGGAVSTVSGSYEPSFAVRSRLGSAEKEQIGVAAAAMIGSNETVIIDGGTTALAVARALRGRRQLTVCALGIQAAAELSDEPGVRVIAAGGDVRPHEQYFTGPLAERVFEDLRFDTFVLSIGGIHVDEGLTDFNPDDARIKRVAVAGSRRRLVVAESGKLGRVTFAAIGPIGTADVLITDSGAASDQVSALKEAGVQVVIA